MTQTHNETQLKQELLEWVSAKAHLQEGSLTPQCELIESRLISSLQILDLILLIEHKTGKQVELGQVSNENFRSINSIYQTFFT